MFKIYTVEENNEIPKNWDQYLDELKLITEIPRLYFHISFLIKKQKLT